MQQCRGIPLGRKGVCLHNSSSVQAMVLQSVCLHKVEPLEPELSRKLVACNSFFVSAFSSYGRVHVGIDKDAILHQERETFYMWGFTGLPENAFFLRCET